MKKVYLIVLVLCFGCIDTTSKQTKDVEIFIDPATQLYGLKQGNEVLLPATYIHIDDFNSCNIAAAIHDVDEYFYIDEKGHRLETPFYIVNNQIDRFKEGFARFEKDKKIGFINECGEIVINAKFELAYPFHNGIATVRKGFKIVQITPEHNVEKGGKFGAIDTLGNLIVPFEYDFIALFNEHKTAIVKKDGEQFLINTKGERIPTDSISP